jgi:nitrogen regulatory protein PII
MKWVSAVIRPSRVDAVVAALDAIGVTRMTMTDVQGSGLQVLHALAEEMEDGPPRERPLVPHVRIEMALPDEHLRAVIEALQHAARTGRIGDGRIFVGKLAFAQRIRTAEKGEAAL